MRTDGEIPALFVHACSMAKIAPVMFLFARFIRLGLMLENESLEFQPAGEPIRHIRRMESLGFYDGRSGEYVIGSVGACTAQTDCCARDCMSVVDLRAVAVDCTDVKPEVEFRLLFRESC